MKLSLRKLNSWQKVLIGLVLGAIIGHVCGEEARDLGYLGTIFLNLIKMVTVPMIFFTILYGITSIESSVGLYRMSLKAFLTFMLTSCFAVMIGFMIALIMKPGVGTAPSVLKQFHKAGNLPKITDDSALDFVVGLIPTNVFAAMAESNILQVIIFAFFIGIALHFQKDHCQNVIKVVQQTAVLFFSIIKFIMRIAPIGVFGYIASLVGTEGIGVLLSLGKLIGTVAIGCCTQYMIFGVLLLTFARLSPLPFYRKMLEIQLLAFATSSSKATLVPLMDKAEKSMGVSRQSSRFLLPLSAALNMDGGAVYQSICAVFFAQMFGLDLTIGQYVTLTLMCTLASIGGAGIPGGVLLFLGMVLHSVGLPIECVLLVATVDRVLDMMTTVINVTGCACVTILIDRSENTLNIAKYNSSSPSRIVKKAIARTF